MKGIYLKFKFFTFFMLFLCAPVMSFGADESACSTVVEEESCNGIESCEWIDGKCSQKCADKSAIYVNDELIEFYSEDNHLIQSGIKDCFASGSFYYECNDGKWTGANSEYSLNTGAKCYASDFGTNVVSGFNRVIIIKRCTEDDKYYNVQGGIITCGACPEGFICKNGDKVLCAEGTYMDTQTRNCVPCETGHYCIGGHTGKNGTAGNSGKHEECPSGQYQDETGQKSCKKVPAGKKANADATGYIDCPGFPINSVGAKEGCTYCDKGKYGYLDGDNIVCNVCTEGHFCPGSMKKDDYKKYSGGADFISALGLKEDEELAFGMEIDCPAGYYSNENSTNKWICDKCANNKTSNPGSTSCEVSLFTNMVFKTSEGDTGWQWPEKVTVSNNIYNYTFRKQQ